LANNPARQRQIAFINEKLVDLSKKANLKSAPELSISKNEHLANVNVYQNRISVGEHILGLWEQGKFSDQDMEATLAHEIGHLMDFYGNSHSHSFRNLIFESLWLSFGVLPVVMYVLSPVLVTLVMAILLAVGWGCSLPFIMRHVEMKIEYEADRNAALYLVAPKQLADALTKISSFNLPTRGLGVLSRFAVLLARVTHPSFSDRVQYLQSL
jgi:Zn-dependent protease with chaperone function